MGLNIIVTLNFTEGNIISVGEGMDILNKYLNTGLQDDKTIVVSSGNFIKFGYCKSNIKIYVVRKIMMNDVPLYEHINLHDMINRNKYHKKKKLIIRKHNVLKYFLNDMIDYGTTYYYAKMEFLYEDIINNNIKQ